jgi:hypothetical protein
VPTETVSEVGLKAKPPLPVVMVTSIVLPAVVAVGLGALVAVGLGALVAVGAGLLPVALPPQAASRKSIATASVQNEASVLGVVVRMVCVVPWVLFCILLPFLPGFDYTTLLEKNTKRGYTSASIVYSEPCNGKHSANFNITHQKTLDFYKLNGYTSTQICRPLFCISMVKTNTFSFASKLPRSALDSLAMEALIYITCIYRENDL